MSSAASCSGDRLYSQAEVYDVAFSYRDYRAECHTLIKWAEKASGRVPKAVLEIAAGPADHATCLGKQGMRAVALDLAQSMCEYATQKAAALGVSLEVVCADMLAFRLDKPVDLAFLMLNSVSHLHTLEALVQHLHCVAESLTDQGVYILEVQHPRDFLGRSTRMYGIGQPWTVERKGLRVTTRWGQPTDPYDPLLQLFSASVQIRIEAEDGSPQVISDVVTMRDWTLGELQAAVKLSGRFELVHSYGDLTETQPLDNSEESWRLCVVLRKL